MELISEDYLPYDISFKDPKYIIPTNLICVKVSYIRPQFYDLKAWMESPNNVYIGRKNMVSIADFSGKKYRWPEKDSIWANPFKIENHCDRENILKKYKLYIIERLNQDINLVDQLLSLRGKNLGCSCIPEEQDRCHGQILLRLIDDFSQSFSQSFSKSFSQK